MKFQIEIENGEVIQLKGFNKSKDCMTNRIGQREIEVYKLA